MSHIYVYAAEEQLKLSEVSKLGIQADLGKIIIFICTNVQMYKCTNVQMY